MEYRFIKVAGFVLRINFFYSMDNLGFEKGFISKIDEYYQNFILNERQPQVDYIVDVRSEDDFKVLINKRKEEIYINMYKTLEKRHIRTFYHLSGIQFQLIIRNITEELLASVGGFVTHASAVSANGKAFIFLGDSGAGKSTTMKTLSSAFKPLADDTVLIRMDGNKYYAYCSTAQEKNSWFMKSYKREDIAALCLVRKAKKTKIRKISSKQKVLDLISKQFFLDQFRIQDQMKNLFAFINCFDNFYYLDVLFEDRDNLEKVISELTYELQD